MHDAGANRDAVLLDGFRKPTGEALHAQSLLVVAAEIFLERDILQQLDAITQSLLLIGLPEKARVVEACAQHAFVAMSDQALGIARRIEHRQKMRSELAIRIFNREILLVVAHHRDQHFFGQSEKLGIEIAEDDGWKFGQVHNSGQEWGIFTPARAGNCARGRVQSFAEDLLALGGTQNLGAAQGFDVGAGASDFRRRMAKQTMTARSLASQDAEHFQRNHLFVEHRDQPAHGADEKFSALAPVHIFRPVQTGDFFGQRFGQNLSRCTALALHRGSQVFALGRSNFFELVDIHADFFRERVGGGRGLSIFERDLRGGPGDLLGDIGLRGGNTRRDDRQAARSVQACKRAIGRETFAAKQGSDALA